MTDLNDLADAVQQSPVTSIRRQRAPQYGGILSGASILSLFGILSIIVGTLALILAVIVLINGMKNPPRDSLGIEDYGQVKEAVGALVFFGIPSIIVGVSLRMVSQIALAIRDIARNSF